MGEAGDEGCFGKKIFLLLFDKCLHTHSSCVHSMNLRSRRPGRERKNQAQEKSKDERHRKSLRIRVRPLGVTIEVKKLNWIRLQIAPVCESLALLVSQKASNKQREERDIRMERDFWPREGGKIELIHWEKEKKIKVTMKCDAENTNCFCGKVSSLKIRFSLVLLSSSREATVHHETRAVRKEKEGAKTTTKQPEEERRGASSNQVEKQS